MKNKLLVLCVLFAICFTSCRSKKNVIYLQNNEQYQSNHAVPNYEAVIQPDDILNIRITSENMEAATPFNPAVVATGLSNNSDTGQQLSGYLVDKEGFIDFPILGHIKVSGYTRTDFIQIMKAKLNSYLSDATVKLVISNFKITVLGEVGKPGVIEVSSDRITFLEAMAKAGDLTLQGLRKNILIVRDNQGVKSFTRVDITRADFVDSPFYYLKQNDVVYVEARRTKIDAGAFGSYFGTFTAIFGFLLTTALLLTRL
jgi:polysaccharide export outer membrane protein